MKSGALATSITSTLGPESVGEALRLLRRRARLSRDELAGRARLSAGAVSNYENDVSAVPATNLRTLIRVLAEELEIDPATVWQEFGELLDTSP
jgi:transcriptional regulator with XRE-family HTH domain